MSDVPVPKWWLNKKLRDKAAKRAKREAEAHAQGRTLRSYTWVKDLVSKDGQATRDTIVAARDHVVAAVQEATGCSLRSSEDIQAQIGLFKKALKEKKPRKKWSKQRSRPLPRKRGKMQKQ